MKRAVIFPLLFTLLFLQGCGEKGQGLLPDISSGKVQILYDIEKVEEKKRASVYHAEYFRPDTKTLQETLLRYPIEKVGVDAFGRYFCTKAPDGMMESLTVYDGGEAFDGNSAGIDGGFNYWFNSNGKIHGNIVHTSFDHQQLIGGQFNRQETSDFQEWKDLDFMSVDEAVSKLEDVMGRCGTPNLQIKTVYALDADMMNQHSEMQTDTAKSNQEEDTADTIWTKEDEAYLFYLRQSVDGIPLIDHFWAPRSNPPRNGYTSETLMDALVSGNGILSFQIAKAVQVLDGEGEKELISAKGAQDIFLAEYDGKTLGSDVCVESQELSYAVLRDGDRMTLVPCWVFCIWTKEKAEGMDMEGRSYDHYVVNAIDGSQVKSEVLK